MSAGAVIAIIMAIVVVLLVIGALTMARRRKLRQRFGPEYDRVAGEMHSRRKADAELAERERRVRSLDIRPLDETARARYAGEWTAIQERFVDRASPVTINPRAQPAARRLSGPRGACAAG